MNAYIHTQEHVEMAPSSEAIPTEEDLLAQWGFTTEEIASLLWLRVGPPIQSPPVASAGEAGGLCPPPEWAASGRSARVTSGPGHRTTARSTTLRNSRPLPGQP